MVHALCRPYLSVFTAVLLLSGCGFHAGSKPQAPVSLAAVTGTWIAPGTGLILRIEADALQTFYHTRATCAAGLRFASLAEAGQYLRDVRVETGVAELSLIPAGGAETDRIYFARAQALPQSCHGVDVAASFDPESTFQHFWHAFNDYYPFFAQRGVDWQQRYTQHRPRVTATTTQTQLFDLLTEMLSPLDDGHVSLVVATGELKKGYSPGVPRDWKVTANLARGGDRSGRAAVINYFNRRLETAHIDGDLALVESDGGAPAMVWGRLDGNVGYLQINQMQGFAPRRDDLLLNTAADLAAVEKVMDGVLDDLHGVTALVVDVRFNGGGADSIALAIAGRFADQKRLVFAKEKYNRGRATARAETYLQPHSGRRLQVPVALITGPDTASAAEIFTLALRQLPNVTHIGQPTRGILSDILDFTLASGWELGLSHEVYYDAGGRVHEAVGIVPDRRVPVTSFNGAVWGMFPAVTQALAGFDIDISLSATEFSVRLQTLMGDALVPGLAAAWVSDSAVLATHAAGYADIGKARKVTARTPFNLASVSKTFIGVAVAQAVEQGLIALDTRMGDLPMPLRVDSPNTPGADITLQHLVSHTAGIKDSDVYFCGYYIEQSKASLAAAMGMLDCPTPVRTEQAVFLADYLQRGGSLYDAAENFLAAPAGAVHFYSNVGAALASRMLAVATRTDFETWTERNIFTPLRMRDTHWFNSRFDGGGERPAVRYVIDGDKPVPLPEYALATWADGGLKSSAADMARYLLAIVRGGELDDRRIADAASVDAMLSPQTELPTLQGSQGIFWVNDGFLFGHDGSDPGATTQMFYDQYHDMGFVLLVNVSDLMDDNKALERRLRALVRLVYRRGLALRRDQ
ncbi:serine hydrolase [Exilibacterium tricleocarpae]|nr:serine hydrolase [Exilibacterium tricleocarpae]